MIKEEYSGGEGDIAGAAAVAEEDFVSQATDRDTPDFAANGLLPNLRVRDVLLISADARLSEELRSHFAAKKRLTLRALRGHLVELENKIAQSRLPDIAVIDLQGGEASEIEALERLKKSRFSKVPAIVISGNLDRRTMRGLMQLKIDDWLPAGCSPAEIEQSCEAAFHAHFAGDKQTSSTCLSFLPATGGCGNTTLAIQSAVLIASKTKHPQSTCLVDLNFQDGAIAEYLDLAPAFELSELSNIAGRLDRQLLEVMLARHNSGISIFAAPHLFGQCATVEDELIATILGLLSESFQHLIVDLPQLWQPWTDNVLWGSDRVYVTTRFTVPALRYARRTADSIATKIAPNAEVSVIVNKFHEPLMGAGLTRRDAEGILEARLGGYLPDLGSSVDEAINRGMPMSAVRPGNKIEKRLSELIDRDLPDLKASKH